LARVDLTSADLSNADLSLANLRSARLFGASLTRTNLTGANLAGADLVQANLAGADLTQANLAGADVAQANLTAAKLREADLSGTNLQETVLSNVDLSVCVGLEKLEHYGPSTIDYRTLQRSGPLPLNFLRGVGLPETLIEYLPSLMGSAIEFYSCFISYARQDEEFAHRLHNDLQQQGIRCWLADADLAPGQNTLAEIDQAIRLFDKSILVLSQHSLQSRWIQKEIEKLLEMERERISTSPVMIPISIDGAIFTAEMGWARIAQSRLIADFSNWRDDKIYRNMLIGLSRTLTISMH
jgi:hypothetical protein